MERAHVPVLVKEVVEWIHGKDGGIYVDATIGSGGHAVALLETYPDIALLVGIDQDAQAVAIAKKNLAAFHKRAIVAHGNFTTIKTILGTLHIEHIDGIIFDLGVSSMQLSNPLRGFSFMAEGPLDMRMDQNSAVQAQDLINTSTASELEEILRTYGEERWARRISRAIHSHRSTQPISTTTELSRIISGAIPARYRSPAINPATRTFQALRIAVNNELKNLHHALDEACDLLNSGGRMGVISFHSLEDRIVKQKFQQWQKGCTCPPRVPQCICGNEKTITMLTKKPVVPTRDEVQVNPRSRSAKLRVAEKI
jgi:16S rRNA (cytosine1402-N4)-methyltransferase